MASSAIEQMLRKNAFFAEFPADTLRFLASHARQQELSDQDVLFPYNAPATQFYLVVSGSIALEVASIEGPPLVLQTLGPGAVLGWSWLIPPYRWNFQARAEESTQVLEFDGTAIREHCGADPAFGYPVLLRFSSLMSERLAFARQRMIESWSPPGLA